ncbi:unnamed protein product, partial [Mycena citricolor]
QSYHASHYSPQPVQYTPPHGGYGGQYGYAYFHSHEQPHSIHAGYQTIPSYPQYQSSPDGQNYAPQSPASGGSQFHYPSLSPGYNPYPQSYPSSYQQHVFPPGAYPAYGPHSAGQENDGGTWWYVPPPHSQQSHSQSPQSYEAGPSNQYSYFPSSIPSQQPQEAQPADSSPRPSSRSSASESGPTSPTPGGREKPVVRRPYHPNPPAHRSEWVMWAGNVPSDAGHDELWRFFTQPEDEASASDAAPELSTSTNVNGVLSIFLISRSSCAFVNYETETHLNAAITRFNGVPLRAGDARCPRLVCRARRKDDDLRAGVGGQRGIGMHARWVKEKAAERRNSEVSLDSSDVAHSLDPQFSSLSLSGDERSAVQPPGTGSPSSGSHASTDSSLLRQHFPQRYFILKSLTREDLDLSVKTGVWSTQKHNEGVLDRAFRNSQDVFLIFSVNKSGEFYGYARMTGPMGSIRSGKRPVGTSSQPLLSTESTLLSAGHFVDASPLEVRSIDSPLNVQSAPAILGQPHRAISGSGPALKFSSVNEPVKLNPLAPIRAIRNAVASSSIEQGLSGGSSLGSVPEEKKAGPVVTEPGAATREDSLGQEFTLEWLCTERLPFTKTRHLRNPWNHDREVKVSRDGTELEPVVGQALLDEWQAVRPGP